MWIERAYCTLRNETIAKRKQTKPLQNETKGNHCETKPNEAIALLLLITVNNKN